MKWGGIIFRTYATYIPSAVWVRRQHNRIVWESLPKHSERERVYGWGGGGRFATRWPRESVLTLARSLSLTHQSHIMHTITFYGCWQVECQGEWAHFPDVVDVAVDAAATYKAFVCHADTIGTAAAAAVLNMCDDACLLRILWRRERVATRSLCTVLYVRNVLYIIHTA